MIKENYHTHTYLCHHAKAEVIDYVKEAINQGFESLGMSDHGPLEGAGFVRMNLDEFYNIYLPELNKCKELYKDKIHLYSGLEIEYLRGRNEYYEKLKNDLDYLILGPHYYSMIDQKSLTSAYHVNDSYTLNSYVTMIEEALETGYFSILAHPDLFLSGYPKWDDELVSAIRRICQACIKNNVILECNTNGYSRGTKDFKSFTDYMYPNYHFFQIVSEFKDLKVIVSSDAHDPKDLTKDMDRGYLMLKELGIKVIENPFGKKND